MCKKAMKQLSLVETGFLPKRGKVTRKAEFLAGMNTVVPWSRLEGLIEPVYRKAGRGRRRTPLLVMLRIHFMQHWFGYSDPAMEEVLHDIPLLRQFAGLDAFEDTIPDEAIQKFRHLLQTNALAVALFAEVNAVLSEKGLSLRHGTAVDATQIAAPSSTKNKDGKRDPEMHQTKKGNQWHFGMEAHRGDAADTVLVHTVIGTVANVNDVIEANVLLHGDEKEAFGDAGYQGAEKRSDATGKVRWKVAMRPGKRRAPDKNQKLTALIEQLEHLKASIRVKVEHPFRVIKRQFGFTKVRYRGLAKNNSALMTLFALSNLWMARRRLLAMTLEVCT